MVKPLRRRQCPSCGRSAGSGCPPPAEGSVNAKQINRRKLPWGDLAEYPELLDTPRRHPRTTSNPYSWRNPRGGELEDTPLAISATGPYPPLLCLARRHPVAVCAVSATKRHAWWERGVVFWWRAALRLLVAGRAWPSSAATRVGLTQDEGVGADWGLDWLCAAPGASSAESRVRGESGCG